MNKRMVFNKDYLNGKTKGHGITRKTKLGVASGIALAGGFAVAGNATMVSANEVSATLKPADTTPVTTTTAEAPTTATAPALEYTNGASNASTVIAENPSPATNLETAQPVATTDNVTAEKEAGQNSGEIRVDVQNKEHDKAVADAKAAGINVQEQPKETAASFEDAQGKLKTETTNIKTVTADFNAKQADYNAKQADYKAKKADYDAKQADFITKTKQYEEATAINNQLKQAVETAKATADEVNKKAGKTVLTISETTKPMTAAEAITSGKQQLELAKKSADDLKAAYATFSGQRSEAEAAKAALDKVIAEAKAQGANITDKGTIKVSNYAEAKAKLEELLEKAQKAKSQTGGNDAKVQEYNKRVQAVIDKNAHTTLPNDPSHPGFTPSGSTSHMSAIDVNGYTFVSEGDLKNPTMYIMRKDGKPIDKSKVVKTISWGNVAPEGPGLSTPTGAWANAYNTKNATQDWMGKRGVWYRIPKAATMLDGSVHDLMMLVDLDQQGLAVNDDQFRFWNADGAINSMDGYGGDHSKDGIRVLFRIDSETNSQQYIWPTVMYDFDGGQFLEVDTGNTAVTAVGGGMQAHRDETASSNVGSFRSHDDLGLNGPGGYGINVDNNALNGRSSSPDGTLLLVQVDAQYNTIIRNSGNSYPTLVARADFGADSAIDLVVQPEVTKPTVETANYVVDTPSANVTVVYGSVEKPVAPVAPKAPVAPHASVTAHSYDVAQKPTISKEVVNNDNVDINRHKVAKNSTVKWVLTTNAEKAGRKAIENGTYRITDALPSGYQVDLDATKAEKGNDAYNIVSFDKNKNILTVALTDAETAKYNANLDKAYDTPNFTVVGRVLNDNATYKNTYRLDIGNQYRIMSNTVEVYTPGGEDPNSPDPKDPNNPHGGSNIEPVKHNRDKDGKDIDGKERLAGSTNNYVGKMDLDQFKGDKSDKASISRGFGFGDTWDKKALNFDVNKVTITTSDEVGKGETIDPSTFVATTYTSLDEVKADKDASAFLKNAGIKVDFDKYNLTLWKAKDSQDFYNKYVVTGTNLYFHMPMDVKSEMAQAGGEYTNKVFQVTFGNGYDGNVVVNKVPTIKPEKDVVIDVSDPTSINDAVVPLGEIRSYKLVGGKVDKEAVSGLFQYGFSDKLDTAHDLYTDYYRVKLANDVTLKDGTTVSKDDVAKYGKAAFKDGVWTFEFDKDFLDNLSGNEDFQAIAYIEFKRIAPGDVYNEYTNTINGVEYLSNKVVTHTPEPPKPETPAKPGVPTPEAPKPQAPATPERKVLPNTGDKGNGAMTAIGITTLAGVTAAALAKRYSRKED